MQLANWANWEQPALWPAKIHRGRPQISIMPWPWPSQTSPPQPPSICCEQGRTSCPGSGRWGCGGHAPMPELIRFHSHLNSSTCLWALLSSFCQASQHLVILTFDLVKSASLAVYSTLLKINSGLDLNVFITTLCLKRTQWHHLFLPYWAGSTEKGSRETPMALPGHSKCILGAEVLPILQALEHRSHVAFDCLEPLPWEPHRDYYLIDSPYRP